MAAPSWHELDERRQALPRRLSRAQWARRAGVSESTITKGLRIGSRPTRAVREKLELILEAVRIEAEDTGRQMDRLGRALEGRLE